MFYTRAMRWDNLLADRDDDGQTETAVLPLFSGEAIVRRFKTPLFRGITFYEVAAKSIINHVLGDRFGFRWTINPFRGCSHACTYCLDGDTPILLATGRTKPLAEVRPGDEIYGTAMTGLSRRYVTTVVSDHWSALKPAYRVTLEGGAQLVTSGDHRFLTEEGWGHVGPGQDAAQRPTLTPGIRLVGTGKFPEAPLHDEGYRRGYVRGLFAREAGPDRRIGFDLEAEERVRAYLRAGLGPRQEVEEDAGEIDGGRPLPARQFRGFLAGVYDATGSYSDAVRLEPEAGEARVVCRCLDELGFRWHQDELKSRPCIRLAGGLGAAMRVFLSVDPATSTKRRIDGVAIEPDAWPRVVSVEALGVELPLYDITTGTGDFIADGVVSHNCFARPTHTYLDFDAREDFEREIVVKVNLPEVLRAELARPSWKREHVALGTNTDPYQWVEGRYRLMPEVWAALRDSDTPCSVLTKSPLLLRDLPVLAELAERVGFTANLSVPTLDERAWRQTEPHTPHPRKRLEAIAELVKAGIPTGVLVAPLIPGVNDQPEQVERIVALASEAGADHIGGIALHLRGEVRDIWFDWLRAKRPDLVPR